MAETFFFKENFSFAFNSYEIYSNNALVGRVNEKTDFLKKMTGRATVDFSDENGKLLFTAVKPFSFLRPKFDIFGADGKLLGSVVKKIMAIGPAFTIYDASGKTIGSFKGDLIGWNYSILDSSGAEVASVNKKFAGIASELLTSKDNYLLTVKNANFPTEISMACPVIADMLLKDNNKRKK